jgi:hypothetical protein
MRHVRHLPLLLAAAISSVCVPVIALTQESPRTSTPEGLQLLRKMQTALGGAEKIAAIRDYEETLQAKTWNADGSPLGEVRKRTRWMRSPNVIRLDQLGPRDTYVLCFDGSIQVGRFCRT